MRPKFIASVALLSVAVVSITFSTQQAGAAGGPTPQPSGPIGSPGQPGLTYVGLSNSQFNPQPGGLPQYLINSIPVYSSTFTFPPPAICNFPGLTAWIHVNGVKHVNIDTGTGVASLDSGNQFYGSGGHSGAAPATIVGDTLPGSGMHMLNFSYIGAGEYYDNGDGTTDYEFHPSIPNQTASFLLVDCNFQIQTQVIDAIGKSKAPAGSVFLRIKSTTISDDPIPCEIEKQTGSLPQSTLFINGKGINKSQIVGTPPKSPCDVTVMVPKDSSGIYSPAGSFFITHHGEVIYYKATLQCGQQASGGAHLLALNKSADAASNPIGPDPCLNFTTQPDLAVVPGNLGVTVNITSPNSPTGQCDTNATYQFKDVDATAIPINMHATELSPCQFQLEFRQDPWNVPYSVSPAWINRDPSFLVDTPTMQPPYWERQLPESWENWAREGYEYKTDYGVRTTSGPRFVPPTQQMPNGVMTRPVQDPFKDKIQRQIEVILNAVYPIALAINKENQQANSPCVDFVSTVRALQKYNAMLDSELQAAQEQFDGVGQANFLLAANVIIYAAQLVGLLGQLYFYVIEGPAFAALSAVKNIKNANTSSIITALYTSAQEAVSTNRAATSALKLFKIDLAVNLTNIAQGLYNRLFENKNGIPSPAIAGDQLDYQTLVANLSGTLNALFGDYATWKTMSDTYQVLQNSSVAASSVVGIFTTLLQLVLTAKAGYDEYKTVLQLKQSNLNGYINSSFLFSKNILYEQQYLKKLADLELPCIQPKIQLTEISPKGAAHVSKRVPLNFALS